MKPEVLRFALLADGSSDRALLPILQWVLLAAAPHLELATPGFRARGHNALREEMLATVAEHRPQLLFVHRGAEGIDPQRRRAEIPDIELPLVKVVPVRMTESWLAFDEHAVRLAAGNPAGNAELGLPPLPRAEACPDPKALLHQALLTAAEVTGRRRKRFQQDLPQRVHRLADLIGDFAPLRRLPAFQQLEVDCAAALRSLGRL